MFKLMLFLSGGLCGWLLRSAYNIHYVKSHPGINYADTHPYAHPEQPMQNLSLRQQKAWSRPAYLRKLSQLKI